MIPRINIGLVLIAVIAVTIGCSGNGDYVQTTTDPGITDRVTDTGPSNHQAVLGTWQVVIDKNTGRFEVTTLRNAEQLLNVLGFLEPPPLYLLDIDWNTLIFEPQNNYLEVVVKLRHPFNDAYNVLMGFDVRGIVFGPDLLNPDGYTPTLNPQYFSDVFFGYIDGLLGAPYSYAHYANEYWPYKYFAKGLGPYESLDEFFSDEENLAARGQFPEGNVSYRLYQLDFGPDTGDFMIFNYAVLVSFDWPTGPPPCDQDDFPIETANTPEPFHARFEVVENNLFYSPLEQTGGGTFSLDVELFDWQGADEAQLRLTSSDGLPMQEVTPAYSESGATPYSTIYHFVDVPASPSDETPLELTLLAVEPNVTYGEIWAFEMMPETHPFYNQPVYSVFTTEVEVPDNQPPLWDPDISIASGYGTVCRHDDPYPDTRSAYDALTRWDYTGGEPYDPDGGTCTKWYYMSLSSDSQTGSPEGWRQFATIGYIELEWDIYEDMAPARLYLWVKAMDDNGGGSEPILWASDGGSIELCKTIAGWNNDFINDWYKGGHSAVIGNYLLLLVEGSNFIDSYVFTNKSWQLGDPSDTSEIKVEFHRSPLAWHINSNQISLMVSYDGQMNPIFPVFSWAGSYPMGGPYLLTFPPTINGEETVGSTRTFGWYMADLTSTAYGIAYIDYMGIYAHPL